MYQKNRIKLVPKYGAGGAIRSIIKRLIRNLGKRGAAKYTTESKYSGEYTKLLEQAARTEAETGVPAELVYKHLAGGADYEQALSLAAREAYGAYAEAPKALVTYNKNGVFHEFNPVDFDNSKFIDYNNLINPMKTPDGVNNFLWFLGGTGTGAGGYYIYDNYVKDDENLPQNGFIKVGDTIEIPLTVDDGIEPKTAQDIMNSTTPKRHDWARLKLQRELQKKAQKEAEQERLRQGAYQFTNPEQYLIVEEDDDIDW